MVVILGTVIPDSNGTINSSEAKLDTAAWKDVFLQLKISPSSNRRERILYF